MLGNQCAMIPLFRYSSVAEFCHRICTQAYLGGRRIRVGRWKVGHDQLDLGVNVVDLVQVLALRPMVRLVKEWRQYYVFRAAVFGFVLESMVKILPDTRSKTQCCMW
jgi:hypothetical protein